MSQEYPERPYEEQEQDQEEFLDVNEVAEEVADDETAPAPEDDDEDMDEDQDALEIDMSNNSWSYFDQHKDSIFTIFKHPKLPLVVTGGADDTAYMWTTHSQPPRFVGELAGHKESVIAGAFTAGGDFVITGDMAGFIQVHKATKGGEKWVKFGELEEVEEVLWITAHPTLPYFAFGANDGSVWVYQIDKSSGLVQIMSGFSHSLECNGGVFFEGKDENDLTLITISEDGTIVNWNCFTGAVNFKLLPHTDFRSVESPWVTIKIYKNVFAVGGRDGQLVIVNNDTGKPVHSLKTLDNVDDIAELSIEAIAWCTSPEINLLAVGLVSGDLLLFETQQWRLRKSIKIDDAITKLEFINNTPTLVGSSMNGKIYKWDARTGGELFAGVGHNMGVLDFAIVDNGKKLVTAGDEGVSLIFHHE
ncbi:WD40 repeat-like protein [Suhomyces tanzawaensis NRRL Y-17324]|uniref:WD40 repeat-like protein n=1 Tax=Suhomyces tanzawaensis NRRL Y-17324 TaxID=984487 RepID=A0A1E4SLB5_9ASCO|nr:WD40 repeat-like protein [Suhomyces tanzawaensis NRRL Y-17324]ODV80315.1 WD40 repeat-like protein [Suhomyces tanzawaensis NRRL Y-17324]